MMEGKGTAGDLVQPSLRGGEGTVPNEVSTKTRSDIRLVQGRAYLARLVQRKKLYHSVVGIERPQEET
jgi:hypothetical protein